MRCEATNGCIVIANTSAPPNDREWEEFLEVVKAHLRSRRKPRGLVYTDGGGPTSLQRHELRKILSGLPDVKAAMLTTSPGARGIMTAISWFVKDFKVFAPKDVDRASEFLELSEVEKRVTLQTLEQVRASLKSA